MALSQRAQIDIFNRYSNCPSTPADIGVWVALFDVLERAHICCGDRDELFRMILCPVFF